jgi:hypothetical protein
MAVNHVVWIKFKAAVPPARVAEHVDALHGLAVRVPGIVELSLGANFTDRANGFTRGLVVTLQDRAALDRYSAHPVPQPPLDAFDYVPRPVLEYLGDELGMSTPELTTLREDPRAASITARGAARDLLIRPVPCI